MTRREVLIREQLQWLADMGVKVDAVLPDGTHLYWCTGHRHGYGDHCSSTKNVHGEPKEPGQCKWCDAQCPGNKCQGCGIEPCEDGRCACPKLAQEEQMPDLNDLENRFTYHPPKPGQPEIYEQIRFAGLGLAVFIKENAPESRELSLAITKIEEAVFWANAAIARGPVEAA